MKPSNHEAKIYLEFVNAAYTMYETDPNNLTPKAQGFPDSKYEILIYLTSIDPSSGSRVFFGFIATDPSAAGSKPGILAIRGTDNFCEWLTDFDATPIEFLPFPGSYVATGFDEFLNGIKWLDADGEAVKVDASLALNWPKGLVLAGHSLGGALATLLAASWLSAINALKLTLVTAACPACGDELFQTRFDELAGERSWRYINEGDVVASSLDLFYCQVENGIDLFSFDILPTPTCEHSLETYLYLLSPEETPCTSHCCFFDEAAKSRLRQLLEERRQARAAAG